MKYTRAIFEDLLILFCICIFLDLLGLRVVVEGEEPDVGFGSLEREVDGSAVGSDAAVLETMWFHRKQFPALLGPTVDELERVFGVRQQ